MKRYVVTDDGNILFYNPLKFQGPMYMWQRNRLQHIYKDSILVEEEIWRWYKVENIKVAIFHSHLIGKEFLE